jgi:hypothetical protein
VNSSTIIGEAFNFKIGIRDVTLTAQSGVVLLRDFVERLGLPKMIDEKIKVKSRERGYPESQNILSLCWNLILGGDCLRDLNVLRSDQGLAHLLGVKSILARRRLESFCATLQLATYI